MKMEAQVNFGEQHHTELPQLAMEQMNQHVCACSTHSDKTACTMENALLEHCFQDKPTGGKLPTAWTMLGVCVDHCAWTMLDVLSADYAGRAPC
jgi:hypothetical protein